MRVALLALLLSIVPAIAEAQEEPPQETQQETQQEAQQDGPSAVETIDRVAVRWYARDAGGAKKPRFIYARELAFEARMEALAERLRLPAAFSEKNLRSALERHITETMLANLPVEPKPTPKEVATYAEAARAILLQRIGDGDVKLGAKLLDEARRAEGITNEELDALLRRRARASWYLDKTIAPMLKPSELDLRQAHRRGETPFTEQRFEEVEPQLRQWFVSTRLATALDRYFRNARARITVFVIAPPTPPRRRQAATSG
ncbi:MAG: hypothetical protein R3B72_30615 [Polyangiaceae bacterium]